MTQRNTSGILGINTWEMFKKIQINYLKNGKKNLGFKNKIQ